MSIPTFSARTQAWSSPPIDDLGYLPSAELLAWDNERLLSVVAQMSENRYSGWRNWQGRWRRVLGLDGTHDKDVLDYGCGVGLEALQYAKAGNDIVVADISRQNVRLALRVLRLHGFEPGAFQIIEQQAVNSLFGPFDVIHCAGVLHHIPDPKRVVCQMHTALRPGGELRLMLYSDQAWRIAVGTQPPDDVTADPGFETFWRHWDPVGGYADWYDRPRLEQRFGEWFTVTDYRPLTEHGEYVGAVLVKKEE